MMLFPGFQLFFQYCSSFFSIVSRFPDSNSKELCPSFESSHSVVSNFLFCCYQVLFLRFQVPCLQFLSFSACSYQAFCSFQAFCHLFPGSLSVAVRLSISCFQALCSCQAFYKLFPGSLFVVSRHSVICFQTL